MQRFIKYKDYKIRTVFYIFEVLYFFYYIFKSIFRKKLCFENKNSLRILIIRRDMLWDFIISIPFFALLKQNFPDSHLYFVWTKGIKSIIPLIKETLFERIFLVDPYFRVPKIFRWKAQYLQKSRNNKDEYDELMKMKDTIDIWIDLRWDLFSLKLIYDLHCKKIISYPIWWWNYFLTDSVPYNYNENEKCHNREMTNYIIKKYSTKDPVYTIPDIKKLLSTKAFVISSQLEENYICIQPGGWRREYKRWSVTNYVQLIHKIFDSYKEIHIKLLSSDEEEHNICEAIQSDIRDTWRITIFHSKDWLETAAIIINSKLFIWHDTSTAHLVDLFDHDWIILFGPGDSKLFTPTSKNITTLFHIYPCQPCEQRKCIYPDNPCINSIQVQEVFNSIKQKHEKKWLF